MRQKSVIMRQKSGVLDKVFILSCRKILCTNPSTRRGQINIYPFPGLTPQAHSPLRLIHPSGSFTPQAHSPLRLIHPSGSFTPQAHPPLRLIHPSGSYTPQAHSPLHTAVLGTQPTLTPLESDRPNDDVRVTDEKRSGELEKRSGELEKRSGELEKRSGELEKRIATLQGTVSYNL